MTRKRSGQDRAALRELPCYSIPEAAHYLRLPSATLRAWVLGQDYTSQGEARRYRPLIVIADRHKHTLSFMNLVEAHVLKAIRRNHKISMQRVRRALSWLKQEYPSNHPLADNRFASDGVDLFVEKYGNLIELSEAPQVAMREILHLYLRRVEWDASGLPVKLVPFTRQDEVEDPGTIEMNPEVAFGQPVLRGTGVPTPIIADRYKAGESIRDLARDYGRTNEEIEEALRCELSLQAA